MAFDLCDTSQGGSGPTRSNNWIEKACLACLLFLLTGCGVNGKTVRNDLDFRPAVSNAFSRAVAFASGEPSVPPHQGNAKKVSNRDGVLYPPVPLEERDPRVRKFIREYAYTRRETMKAYLSQAEQYLPMVRASARESGLPEDLAYLVLLESGADPEARSPANALGMWQFMPSTARSYGLRVDSWVDERLDPEKSTKAALLYLKDLYGMFGCWRLALSAYNSGENKLNKVLCQEDAGEYDEICSSRRLKRETREFLPRFQAITVIAKTPLKYGFASLVEDMPGKKHEFISIDGSYKLETLAKATDVPVSKLVDLNPALVRGVTPKEGSPFSLRLPMGKKQVLANKIKNLNEDRGSDHMVHVVNKGENLSKILRLYQVHKKKLAELNPDLNLRRRLRAGTKIVVPIHKVQTRKAIENERISLLTIN